MIRYITDKLPMFEHQKAALHAAIPVIRKNKFFAFFMEMGAGKTKTSLHLSEVLFHAQDIQLTFVICPKGLIRTWEKEIHTHLNNFSFIVINPAEMKKKSFSTYMQSFFNIKNHKLIILNIESFQLKNKDFEFYLYNLLHKYKSFVVLDESSKIKNPTANRTKNLWKVFADAAAKLILTGTEITNSVLDLYAQFYFLHPKFWPYRNFYGFKLRYAVLEKAYAAGGRQFDKIVGFQNLQELKSRIDPYCFRIKKADCMDLPEKIFETVLVEMNKDQAKFYADLKNNLWAEYKNQEIDVKTKIALFTKFRQIACGFMPETGTLLGKSNTKLDFILEDTENITDKKIIFSNFKAELEHCRTVFNSPALFFSDYDTLDKFSGQCDTALISLKKGSFGLNLQFCSLVYYFSPGTSPEEMWQSQDRVHRPGQKNHPVYKYLIAENTVESRILQRVNQKEDLKNDFASSTCKDFFDLI